MNRLENKAKVDVESGSPEDSESVAGKWRKEFQFVTET